MLPDEVLLEIFDFYMVGASEDEELKDWRDAWQTLVHVCRRWRSVVFGSPRRLDLQLVCTARTPVSRLDVWPALPLVIDGDTENVDNIVALLECSDRINQINLWGSNWEDILEAMEVPFPELTYLWLQHFDEDTDEPVPPLSDSFLGGSAPRLQYLYLGGIPFPGLPKLLLSATHLTNLHLYDIPHSGYISPEAIIPCLSPSTSLDYLHLEFESPQSRPDRENRRPPPSTRAVLPALTRFGFKGDGEYLEDLMARVDAPRLNSFETTFFNDIDFDVPQFTQFIGRTLTLEAFDKAIVVLRDHHACIKLYSKASNDTRFNVGIVCGELDWQISFLEQVCTSSLPSLSALEDLYISDNLYEQPASEDNIDSALWLELLRPFSTVKDLFLSKKMALRVVPVLQELAGGRTTEVLPALQNVFIEGLEPSGLVQEGVGKFVAARQVASHPIAVSRWDRVPGRDWITYN